MQQHNVPRPAVRTAIDDLADGLEGLPIGQMPCLSHDAALKEPRPTTRPLKVWVVIAFHGQEIYPGEMVNQTRRDVP